MSRSQAIMRRGERNLSPPPPVAPGLEELVTAVRAAVDGHADWRRTADLVAGALRRHLPSPDILSVEQRIGDPESYRRRAT